MTHQCVYGKAKQLGSDNKASQNESQEQQLSIMWSFYYCNKTQLHTLWLLYQQADTQPWALDEANNIAMLQVRHILVVDG